MITTRDAVLILDRNGFRIPNAGLDRFGEITYNGERVGTLYEDEIYIASEFPSLRNNTYADTKKQGSIRLASRTARSELKNAIQLLFESPARFEQELRNERVKNVRHYFNFRQYYASSESRNDS